MIKTNVGFLAAPFWYRWILNQQTIKNVRIWGIFICWETGNLHIISSVQTQMMTKLFLYKSQAQFNLFYILEQKQIVKSLYYMSTAMLILSLGIFKANLNLTKQCISVGSLLKICHSPNLASVSTWWLYREKNKIHRNTLFFLILVLLLWIF